MKYYQPCDYTELLCALGGTGASILYVYNNTEVSLPGHVFIPTLMMSDKEKKDIDFVIQDSVCCVHFIAYLLVRGQLQGFECFDGTDLEPYLCSLCMYSLWSSDLFLSSIHRLSRRRIPTSRSWEPLPAFPFKWSLAFHRIFYEFAILFFQFWFFFPNLNVMFTVHCSF